MRGRARSLGNLSGEFRKVFDAVVGRADYVLGHSYDQGSARRAVAARALRYANQLQKLDRVKSTTPLRRRTEIHRLLMSFDARFCSLILSRKGDPITLAEAYAITSALNPRVDCGEPISFYDKPKPEGGFRPIWIFGPKRRALQRLARDILQVLWGPARLDFAQRGKGRDAALRNLISSAEKKGGPKWFLTADITNCFGSFEADKLLDLIPLPMNVIRNSILIPKHTKIITNDHPTATSEKAVPAGLPQGSLVSFYIACKLIEPVLETLTGQLVMSYADDIIVGAGSEKECEANKLLLGDLLADHPAGPLLMKCAVAKIGKPIDYLGHRLRRRWLIYGGGVRLVPSPKSFSRFCARLSAKLLKLPATEIEKGALEYMKNWMNAYPLWDCSEIAQTNVYGQVWHVTSAVKSWKKHGCAAKTNVQVQ